MKKDIQRFQINDFNVHMSLLLKNIFKNSNVISYLDQVVNINNILESLRYIGISEQGFIYAVQIWFSDIDAERDVQYFESFLFSFALNAVAYSLVRLPSCSCVEPEMEVFAYLEGLYVPRQTISEFISFIGDLSISEAVSSKFISLLGEIADDQSKHLFELEEDFF